MTKNLTIISINAKGLSTYHKFQALLSKLSTQHPSIQSPNISQDLQFHIRLHKIIICFDLDMDFLLDNNIVTAIVMINELIHLVKLYHAIVIYCEQNI